MSYPVITAQGNDTAVGDGLGVDGSWLGGEGTASVFGTFNGATVALQVSYDGTTYFDMGTDVTFTEDGNGNFRVPKGSLLRWTTTVANPTSVTAYVGMSSKRG